MSIENKSEIEMVFNATFTELVNRGIPEALTYLTLGISGLNHLSHIVLNYYQTDIQANDLDLVRYKAAWAHYQAADLDAPINLGSIGRAL